MFKKKFNAYQDHCTCFFDVLFSKIRIGRCCFIHDMDYVYDWTTYIVFAVIAIYANAFLEYHNLWVYIIGTLVIFAYKIYADIKLTICVIKKSFEEKRFILKILGFFTALIMFIGVSILGIPFYLKAQLFKL